MNTPLSKTRKNGKQDSIFVFIIVIAGINLSSWMLEYKTSLSKTYLSCANKRWGGVNSNTDIFADFKELNQHSYEKVKPIKL